MKHIATKNMSYKMLRYEYSNLLCSLAHRFYYNHNSAKCYSKWTNMRDWHEGRRDVSRSLLRDGLQRLDAEDKKFVLDEIKKTIALCKRHGID